MTRTEREETPRWLLLIHQIPPKPAYFRAKVGRRLARLGAVPIKNAVYALPANEATREDFGWLAREIAQDGGEATVCAANLVDGLTNEAVEALFQAAREADYAEIAREARAQARLPAARLRDPKKRPELEADLARRKKRLGEVVALDFFGAPGHEAAEASLAALEKRLGAGAKGEPEPAPRARVRIADYQRRVWVTRKNVHVDRIACAWLVRRFVDARARFAFVAPHGYVAKRGEVTFDMVDGDFTHVGDKCSFETMIDRFELRAPGLSAIAEIIHDIDVKDGKFGREEAPGVAALVAGIAVAHTDDLARIAAGEIAFDALRALYARKKA